MKRILCKSFLCFVSQVSWAQTGLRQVPNPLLQSALRSLLNDAALSSGRQLPQLL